MIGGKRTRKNISGVNVSSFYIKTKDNEKLKKNDKQLKINILLITNRPISNFPLR
jgi:hypothetical protein